MKTPTKTKKAKSTKRAEIPASKLLRAEASRLDVVRHAMPDKAQGMLSAQVWAYNMAAAYLDSLGAPEKLVRYLPASSA